MGTTLLLVRTALWPGLVSCVSEPKGSHVYKSLRLNTLADWWPVVSALLSAVTLLVSGLATIIARSLLGSIKELHDADLQMRKELALVRELIAGDYVKRAEYVISHEAQRRDFERTIGLLEERLRNTELRIASLEGRRRVGDKDDR